MTQVVMTQRAAAHSRFSPESADSITGTTVRVFCAASHRRGLPAEVEATVLAATVADEGRALELTLELPEAFARGASLVADITPGPYSIDGAGPIL